MTNFETRAYYDGAFQIESNNKSFEVYNPSSGKKITDVSDCGVTETKEAISSAKEAFTTWSKTTAKHRASLMLKIRDGLLEEKDVIATILTKENGKPIGESKGEVGFAASFFEWFAEEARRQYGDTIPCSTPSKRMITIKQPAGVAALITPWNFPIGMLGRKVAAAMAAGCTCVVKPAEDTPLTALMFAKICHNAGIPKGVINVIPCSRDRVEEVGNELCRSEDIQVMSFTGSTRVGQLLYSKCANTVKRLGMELGGNAPFIVFKSANVEKAINGAMASKFRNSGQTCVTANRIFVHESIYDRFLNGFCEAIDKELIVKDGMDPSSTQGPLINQRQYDRLVKLVDESVKSGATILKGGKPLGGLFYAPTIMTNIKPETPIGGEEIFGPVAALIKFKDEAEVVAQANNTDKGLAGYFYSNDLSQIWRVAEALEYGMVGVNEPAHGFVL